MKRKTEVTSDVHTAIDRVNAAILAFAVFCMYSVYSHYQWKHFITPSWDLGIFSQLAQEYSNFHFPPIVTIKGPGFNLWGDHFHPILILLGPIYKIFPSPATLLYTQDFLVALSVFMLVRFAQRVIGTWMALIMGVAYALSFGVQQAVSVQFHEVAFALPFLMMSLGHMVLSRLGQDTTSHLTKAVLWSIPVAFVKEDMGMTVLMIGAVVLWLSQWLGTSRDILFPRIGVEAPSWKNRFSSLLTSLKNHRVAALALATILFGGVVSILAIEVILPAFNTGGVFDYADKMDIPAALADPLQSLGLMFYPWQKTTTLLMLLLTGVIAWLFSPLALIALPTIAWRFLSPQEGYWEPTWHYNLVLMPIIFMALLDTLAKIRVTSEAPTHIGAKRAKKMGTDFLLLYRNHAHRLMPILALVVALAMLPTQPLHDFTKDSFATSKESSTDKLKQQVVDYIPENVTVASDLSVLTYLVPHREVYWIGHEGEPAPDYVVIDQKGSAWGGNSPNSPAQYAANRYQKKYTVEKQIGTIAIVRKVS